jgi:hypothetical protein
MAGHRTAYVVDASSWISIEGHPAQNLILSRLPDLIEAGRMFCPPEAWEEVKKCPQVKAWLTQYESRIVKRISDVDYLLRVGAVTRQHPSMAGARSKKNRADPYVVAMASYLNQKSNPGVHVVVSEESAVVRPSRKISAACRAFNVQHDSLDDVLLREFPNDPWP